MMMWLSFCSFIFVRNQKRLPIHTLGTSRTDLLGRTSKLGCLEHLEILTSVPTQSLWSSLSTRSLFCNISFESISSNLEELIADDFSNCEHLKEARNLYTQATIIEKTIQTAMLRGESGDINLHNTLHPTSSAAPLLKNDRMPFRYIATFI